MIMFSSRTPVDFHETTRWFVPEDTIQHNYSCDIKVRNPTFCNISCLLAQKLHSILYIWPDNIPRERFYVVEELDAYSIILQKNVDAPCFMPNAKGSPNTNS
jgi:hypothetical protein